MAKRFEMSLLLIAGLVLFTGVQAWSAAPVLEVRIADGTGDWGYPNPFRHYPRGPGYVRMSWVFDTLIWKDQKGFIPALAESWRYDTEKKTFLFKLNPKARWHDGKPVTAADVVFTIGYYRKHPYRSLDISRIDSAAAKDRHTVAIRLARPFAPFLHDIGGTMPILPKHIWEAVDKPEAFTGPEAFIGSGPYLFRDFNKTQGTYLYEAFPDYYQGRPRADRLIYIRSGKPLVSLTTGQADLANIQPDMAPMLEKKGLIILRNKHGWNKKLMINHRKPPFNDRRFRQALAYAINQREIIDKGHRGFAAPASPGLLSIDHELYNPDTPVYPHDPKKARRLIESLGFRTGADGCYERNGQRLALTLLSSAITVAGESGPDRDGEIIRKQLEEAGIKVELLALEQTTTDSRIKNWDFDLAISGHGGIYGDPVILNQMISSAYGAGSVNCARYDANHELNRLLEAQLGEMDPATRKKIVGEIQKIYTQDLPAISLYYPENLAAYNPKKGIAWFYTKGGIGTGIPIPQNKMALIR